MRARARALENDTNDMDSVGIELHGKVLYIEDNAVNFAVLEAGLAHLPGVQLMHAANGVEGVRMGRSECPDDDVLQDMHLGDMSGLEVVRQISGDIAARRMRVTILTGDGFSMDVIKAEIAALVQFRSQIGVRGLNANLADRRREDPSQHSARLRRRCGGQAQLTRRFRLSRMRPQRLANVVMDWATAKSSHRIDLVSPASK